MPWKRFLVDRWRRKHDVDDDDEDQEEKKTTLLLTRMYTEN